MSPDPFDFSLEREMNSHHIAVDLNADDILNKESTPDWIAAAGFSAERATIYLRRRATDLQVFHEKTRRQRAMGGSSSLSEGIKGVRTH